VERGLTLRDVLIAIPLIALLGIVGTAIFNRNVRYPSCELRAMAACKTYAEAQEIYLRTDHNGDGIKEYAQFIAGGDGKYGLWTDGSPGATQGDLSLVDAAFANAEGDPGIARPRDGYVFRVLTSQGASARGGKKSYLFDGRLVNGYGLSAVPNKYDRTGRITYCINNTGQIFGKDRGLEGSVYHLENYNPDDTWAVEE